MNDPRERWVDADAGPVVRPYAMTRGRTRPSGRPLDLATIVLANGAPPQGAAHLDPELLRTWQLCRRPASVADVASELNLPLPVVRVLLGDLRELGLLSTRETAPTSQPPDERIFREILDGLRAL
jgi:hypothetical protein